MGGYKGTILEVNLTAGIIKHSIVEEEVLRKFIGGSGLAAKLFLDHVPPGIDPLSEDNVLFLMTGPLVGTNFPGTSRFTASFKSPLTNIWGESCCGGNFAPELKFAGYDGIAIEGASRQPVYLFIEDNRVEIRDASDLWGKDIGETTDLLKERLGGKRKVKVLAIGQGGENLVKYALIMNDKSDALGRCGGGAVMGSKKLKAIAVRGTGKVELASPTQYAKIRKAALDKIKGSLVAQGMRITGTNGDMIMHALSGCLPAKNWSLGETFDLASEIDAGTMNEKYLIRAHACPGCPIGCGRVVRVQEGPYKTEEGPGPQYETCASFGSLLMINDLAAIIKLNETLSRRYGLDSISCGSAIAFAIDCFENGLIGLKDTNGIELKWGDVDAVRKMVDKIAYRDGFGDLLAEGSKRAAEQIGKNALDYTVEVKGLDAPMWDPRALHGLGLAFAMCNRGACHIEHFVSLVEENVTTFPDIGLTGPYEGKESEGKAEMTLTCENLGMVTNAAILCNFNMGCLDIGDLVDVMVATTGFDYDLEELMECGERIWVLKRGLNNLMGITAADDRLPKRIMTPTQEGPAAGSVPNMDLMLKEYYRLRGLDVNGHPIKEKLHSLGLSNLAAKLSALPREFYDSLG